MSLRDQQLTVAFYTDEVSPRADVIEMTWGELVETLTEDRPAPCNLATCQGKKCPHKSSTGADELGAWSPVSLREPRRNNDLVEAVHVLVLDGDGLTAEQLQEVAQKLAGGSWVAHTTHRHREGCAFIRVALQLSRPVLAAEWREFRARAIDLLGLGEIFDPTCKDLSRLYFLPTHPSDAPFFAEVGSGEPLNVDLVLARSSAAPANDHFEPEPDAPTEAFTNLGSLVLSLKSYRRDRAHRASQIDKEKAALIGRLLAGEPLAAPGGNADPSPIEPPADLPKGRGYALARVARICTGYLPADTPDEAYLQIFSRSLDAMCFGRPADREEMEEHLLEKLRIGRSEREKWDAERASRNTAAKTYMTAVMEERNKLRQAQAPVAEQSSSSTPSEQPVESAESDAWMDALQTTKDGEKLRDSAINAHLILKNATEFRGCFRWNEVDLRIDVFGIFAGVEQEVLDVHVSNYLALKWGLNVRADVVFRQVALLAFEHRYDPIKDYLRSLKWDGTPRLDTWLETYAGAKYDDAKLIGKIGRKWLIGAAARALDPGVKMDLVLVIEGKQGRRKTSLLEALGGDWYGEMAIAIGDKDSKMAAARSWITELPDLAALKRKGESNMIKAFFSTRIDLFRPPFGRAMIRSARRNAFAATTNDDEYLSDPTGNRRYACVKCDEIDIAAVKRDRDQIWAEATYLYNRHVNECVDKMQCGCWWFDKEEAEQVENLAEQRTEESPHETAIMEWWTGLAPPSRPAEITTNSLAKEAFQFTQDRINARVLSEISVALVKLGFKKERPQVKNKRTRIYLPTPEMLALPQSEEGKRKSIKFKPNLKVVE